MKMQLWRILSVFVLYWLAGMFFYFAGGWPAVAGGLFLAWAHAADFHWRRRL